MLVCRRVLLLLPLVAAASCLKPSGTACACSPPMGSTCEAEVTAYKDSSCASNSVLLDVTVSDAPGPAPCFAVLPNTPLRGLTEAWTKNQPGHCDPIQSSPVGAFKAVESTAWEFCCADPDTPDP